MKMGSAKMLPVNMFFFFLAQPHYSVHCLEKFSFLHILFRTLLYSLTRPDFYQIDLYGCLVLGCKLLMDPCHVPRAASSV